MAYYTYFAGELKVKLTGSGLQAVQDYVASEGVGIKVTDSSLKVSEEWRDSGLMEYVVQMIAEKGQLLSGSIKCEGEDRKDVWEIFVDGGSAYIRELGTSIRVDRVERKVALGNRGAADSYRLC